MIYYLTMILFLFTISCAGYKTHQYPEANEKDFHVDYYTGSGEDQLEFARQFTGEGDYDTAIDLYLKVYENSGNDSLIRQEALLSLGQTYSNVLHSGKDYRKAIYFFKKLLVEFPETQFRSGATESIRNIKGLLHHP